MLSTDFSGMQMLDEFATRRPLASHANISQHVSVKDENVLVGCPSSHSLYGPILKQVIIVHVSAIRNTLEKIAPGNIAPSPAETRRTF